MDQKNEAIRDESATKTALSLILTIISCQITDSATLGNQIEGGLYSLTSSKLCKKQC